MWFIEGEPIELIYGLKYTGGKTGENGEMLTLVYNQNDSFNYYLTQKQLKNLKTIYMDFVEKNQRVVPPEHLRLLRLKKLNKINKIR